MTEKNNSYDAYLENILKDPKEAAAYLNAALAEDDPEIFTLALRDVVMALGGGVGRVAEKTSLNRESLYRMLSRKGNPRFSSLYSVMQSLGLEVQVTPRHKKTSSTSEHPVH